MPDTDGSLETQAGQAGGPAKPSSSGNLGPRAVIIATCLLLVGAAGAAAQQPVVAPPPTVTEFFSRFDFHLTAAWLGESGSAPPTSSPAAPITNPADHRYSFDTHWGGSLDFVDYVVGRTSFIIDYEALLGDEFRIFDPNQGIYTLEAASSARIGSAEVVGIFHHVSRHLADRSNQQAVAWNAAGVRLLKRVTGGSTTFDVDAEVSGVTAKAYVDYSWIGELNLSVRHPLNPHVVVFAQGSGKVFTVDGSVPGRSTQTGGVAEAGVRLKGTGGVLELFVGFEKRVDAYELERKSQSWTLAGFRLLSR